MNKVSKPTTREHARFALDLRLIVRTATRVYGRTRDISETGLGATVPEDLALGDTMELEFELPESAEPLTLIARVSYRHGFHYGFKFISPTARQIQQIRRSTRDLPVIR
jgi:hypothetical protein